MTHLVEAKTLHGLHRKLVRSVVTDPDPDLVTSIDVQHHTVLARAASLGDYKLDFKDLWLTPTRWTVMVRQYVDVDRLTTWLDLVKHIARKGRRARGQALMRSKDVDSHGGGRSTRRRWGSCMLAWSWKMTPRPTLTMMSRTSYLGYIAGLDLGVGWRLGQVAAELCGVDPADVQFVWHVDSAQWHSFKSMCWLFSSGDSAWLDEVRDDEPASTPALEQSRQWLARLHKLDEEGVLYGDMAYAQLTRVRRRYHAETYGEDFANQFRGGTLRPKSLRQANRPLPSSPIERYHLWTPLRLDPEEAMA